MGAISRMRPMTIRKTKIDLLSLSALGFFFVYVGTALIA